VPASVSSLIPTVDALRRASTGQDRDLPVAAWQSLSTLMDPRDRRGRRHELATVLVVAAVLVGAKSLAGIAAGPTTSRRGRWPGSGWRVARRACPRSAGSCSSWTRRPGRDAVLHAWLAALAPPPTVPAAFRAVAVDSKTFRGALGPDGTWVHLFSIVEHATGIPLGQVQAPSKGFEIASTVRATCNGSDCLGSSSTSSPRGTPGTSG